MLAVGQELGQAVAGTGRGLGEGLDLAGGGVDQVNDRQVKWIVRQVHARWQGRPKQDRLAIGGEGRAGDVDLVSQQDGLARAGDHVEHEQAAAAHYRAGGAVAVDHYPGCARLPLKAKRERQVGPQVLDSPVLDVEDVQAAPGNPHAVAGVVLLDQQQIGPRHPGHGLGNAVAGRGEHREGDILIRLAGKAQVGQSGVEINPGLVAGCRPHGAEWAGSHGILGRPAEQTVQSNALDLLAAAHVVHGRRGGRRPGGVQHQLLARGREA